MFRRVLEVGIVFAEVFEQVHFLHVVHEEVSALGYGFRGDLLLYLLEVAAVLLYFLEVIEFFFSRPMILGRRGIGIVLTFFLFL